jgi:hypothetical protein
MKSILTVALLGSLIFPFSEEGHSQSAAWDAIPPFYSTEEKAAACARTLERFIPELDALLEESPTSARRYDAVLAKHLFLNNGVPGLPTPLPDASIHGCNLDKTVEIVKRSKFFHKATPVSEHFLHYIIQFRSRRAVVGFAIEKKTGNIVRPYSDWTTVYP